jgi:YegS/Rv2252/BmrU family lipid kinase
MIDSNRILVILNPVAGKGKAGERLPEIERLLVSRGLAFDLRLTEEPSHATRIAEAVDAGTYSVVVAAGGDGTVNETVNGLMAAKAAGKRVPALGVLSVGRGNDFSYGADLPGDLSGCIGVLAGNTRRSLDVGLVTGGDFPEGKYFANGIGVGFDTIVGLEAARMKHVHGFMAYVFGALRTFIKFPDAPEVKISWDDALMSIESHQISIMNGKRMGGTFFMAPWAENHDGRLELCMAGRMNRREMVDLMIRYTKGSQVGHPKITTASAARYRIEAPKGGLVVHADGETVCIDGRSLDVECIPGALEIVCDPGRVERERSAAQAGKSAKPSPR